MRWVQQAAMRPHRCAVFPQFGNSSVKAGFFDTGQDFRDRDHCYVSVEAVEVMARQIGWQPASVVAPLEAKLKARDERIAELEAQLEDANAFKAATEYTLSAFGSKVRAKPGRKAAA